MAKATSKKEELRVSFLPGGVSENKGEIWSARRGWAIFVVVILVVAGVGGVFSIAASRAKVRAHAARQSQRVSEAQAVQREGALTEALQVARNAQEAKRALARHINAAQALVVLERAAVSEAQLLQISLDTKGTAVISGRGANYAAVVRQILSWNADAAIKSTRVSGVLAKIDPLGATSGIQFNATLTFAPEVFIAQPL